MFYPLLMMFLKSPERGCESAVYCATSEDLIGVNGKHIVDSKVVEIPLPRSLDNEAANRLVNISKSLTGMNCEQ